MTTSDTRPAFRASGTPSSFRCPLCRPPGPTVRTRLGAALLESSTKKSFEVAGHMALMDAQCTRKVVSGVSHLPAPQVIWGSKQSFAGSHGAGGGGGAANTHEDHHNAESFLLYRCCIMDMLWPSMCGHFYNGALLWFAVVSLTSWPLSYTSPD